MLNNDFQFLLDEFDQLLEEDYEEGWYEKDIESFCEEEEEWEN